AWTLARPGAAPFELATTLAAEGVLDGEVLHLVDASRWHAPTVVDVADAVAAELERGPAWTAAATAWLLAGLAIAGFVLAAALAVVSGAVDRGAGALALTGAVGLLALAVALPALAMPALGDRGPARVALGLGAAALCGLAFWVLDGAPRDDG